MHKTVGAAIGAIGVWTLPAAAIASGQVARLLGMQTHLETRRAVALTFDDGPHPEGTPAVLDALARLGTRATFFLTGEQVLRHPAVAQQIATRGHTVGVHGHRHHLLTVRTPSACVADMRLARRVIANATGTTPGVYRPPYGVANPAVLLTARRSGLRPVLWARWGRDWERQATAESIVANATRELRGGEILLLHDSDRYSAPESWRATVTALPDIVAAVERAGLSFLALE